MARVGVTNMASYMWGVTQIRAARRTPLAPLHLHLRLAGDPEVTLHYLTMPPHTL